MAAIVGGVVLAVLVAWLVAAATDGDGEDRAEPPTTTSSSPRDSGTGTTATRPEGSTASTPPDDAGRRAFGDGLWAVGEDVEPGRYIAAGIDGAGCDWARTSDAAGTAVIAAGSNVANQAIVDILGTDAAFRTRGCGTWARYAAPGPPLLTTIDEGDWVVGEQIEPGTYLAAQAPTCSWTRASGFEHSSREVIQTEHTNIALEGPFLVTVAAGERFTSRGCATWVQAD